MKAKPRISVCLCIHKKGKILLHKRKGGNFNDTWAFPGGHLEFGESFEQCALRELQEEAGSIKTTPPEFWTISNNVVADKKHYIVIFMKANWVEGEAEVKEPEKCHCWEWFSKKKIPESIMPGIQDIINRGELK